MSGAAPARTLISVARRVLSIGVAAACVACQSSHAAEPPAETRFRYSGKLTMSAEQSDSIAACSENTGEYETSGFLSLDSARRRVLVEGYGCTLDVESAGSAVSGSPQLCVIARLANFTGVGVSELRFESLSMDVNAGTITWSARAFRDLPSGRVAYCLELDGTLEAR
jgi:hypothetical protein